MYKDFATGEVGDEIGLLGRIHKLNPHDDFLKLLKIYNDLAKGKRLRSIPPQQSPKPSPKAKPDATGLGPGTYHYSDFLRDFHFVSSNIRRFR